MPLDSEYIWLLVAAIVWLFDISGNGSRTVQVLASRKDVTRLEKIFTNQWVALLVLLSLAGIVLAGLATFTALSAGLFSCWRLIAVLLVEIISRRDFVSQTEERRNLGQ